MSLIQSVNKWPRFVYQLFHIHAARPPGAPYSALFVLSDVAQLDGASGFGRAIYLLYPTLDFSVNYWHNALFLVLEPE